MLTIILAVLFSLEVSAYVSGDDYCRTNAHDEIGRFHEVAAGLRVYSYFKRPFKKELPTIVFFAGGPGSSIRGNEFTLSRYNVLFFEERGMGCSRPENQWTFLDPETYGARRTVQDVRTILRDYELEQVILYGHSYGTVLATMFASEYPSITEKVILEGTIYKGDVGIWRSEIRRKNLQQTFDKLSLEEQQIILYYSNHRSLSPDWFSVVGTMMSYLDNAYDVYEAFLHDILRMEEEAFISFIQSFYVSPDFEQEGEVVFGMLTCRELSGTLETSNLHLVFDQKKILQWKEGSDVARSYCDPLGARTKVTIDLSNYPVHVPVVYLAGEQDGATDLLQVKNHYARVSSAEKTLYVMKRGGHLPNLGALKDDRVCSDEEDCRNLAAVKAQVRFFQSILRKSRLDEKELDSVNQLLPNPWYVSSEAR